MDINELIKFGMTKTEAEIYLEIAKTNGTKIGPIIKKTELHRGTVYNSINSLIEKGFLSFIDKERMRFYKFSGKKVFKEIIKEEEDKLTEGGRQITNFFEGLEKLKDKEESQSVQVFYGIKAFKSLFLEIYDECEKNNWEYLFQGKGGRCKKLQEKRFIDLLKN